MKKSLLALLMYAASAHAGVIVSLLSPDITGAAGGVTGWGFMMTIDSPVYVVVNSSSYVRDEDLGSQIGYSFETDTFWPEIIGINGGAQDLGWSTQADSPWTQAFSYLLFQGVRAFQVCSASDPVCGFNPIIGAIEYGKLSVTYSVSTFAPGSIYYDPVQTTQEFDVSITASAPETAVPEPGTVLLSGAASVLLLLLVRRRMESRA